MGRFPKGVFSAFRGKVGALVGGKWKDTETVRTRPERSKSAKSTVAQLAQQAKFGMSVKFMRTINIVIKDIYRSYPQSMTAVNSALSKAVREAIVGDYPALSFDYRKIIIARGSLPRAANSVASSEAAGSITFRWTDNSGVVRASAADKAIAVVYCEEEDQYAYSLDLATRNQGTGTLNVSAFAGKQVHTWLSFLSENGKDVADSVYTGAVQVQ